MSFERSFADNGYDVYMYDHTIQGLPDEHERFHYQRKGITGTKDLKMPALSTLKELIAENGHDAENNMFLKMDVEGAEIGVFKTMPEELQNKFAQIVLELHDFTVEERWDSLSDTLRQINRTHQLVHLHANNCGHLLYRGDKVVPHAFEATYVRKSDFTFKHKSGVVDTELDYKCTRLPRREWLTWQP